MTAAEFRHQLNSSLGLTGPEWAAGQALASFMDENGRCRRPIEQIAARCRLADRTVRRALDGLAGHGLIVRHRHRQPGRVQWDVTEYVAIPVGEAAVENPGDSTYRPERPLAYSGRSDRILSREKLSPSAVGETDVDEVKSPQDPQWVDWDAESGKSGSQPSTSACREGAEGAAVADCGDLDDLDFGEIMRQAQARLDEEARGAADHAPLASLPSPDST